MRTRLIAGFAGAPFYIAAILWPGTAMPFYGWPFAFLVLAMILVGLHEFYAGCKQAGYRPREIVGYLAGLLLWWAATPWRSPQDPVFALAMTLLVMASMASEAIRKDHAPLKSLAPTWLGIAYVGWLFPFAVRLRLSTPQAAQHLNWTLPRDWMADFGQGGWLLLFTVLVTAAVDSGAYFAGKSLGKHKLAPIVSPGKTWEGSIGGFLAGLAIAWITARLIDLPVGFALVAAALIGVLAQLGDLAKSAVKREIGIKDFGTLIPGHGGVLDRFDSLMFTAPTVFWLLIYWGAR